MVLKSISVRNFGSVDFFTCDLSETLNVIKNYATDELSYAIGAILNSKATPSLIVKELLERLDEAVDVGELIERTVKLKCQVIVLTLPCERGGDRAVKYCRK